MGLFDWIEDLSALVALALTIGCLAVWGGIISGAM